MGVLVLCILVFTVFLCCFSYVYLFIVLFGLIIIIIIIIIIIVINCKWVDTRWQWLFYMYTKYDIDYY
jgi:hypothetical protein